MACGIYLQFAGINAYGLEYIIFIFVPLVQLFFFVKSRMSVPRFLHSEAYDIAILTCLNI